MVSKIRKFLSEAIAELKKVSWSTRQEVIEATWVVLVSAAFLGLFIATADFFLSIFINSLINR